MKLRRMKENEKRKQYSSV